MTSYAQTNIQLYNQLSELGYSAADRERIVQFHADGMTATAIAKPSLMAICG